MTAGCVGCAAEAAADQLHIDGFTSFADVLVETWSEFRPHDSGRFEVRRTRFTEDREPISRGLRFLIYKRDNFRCVWCGSTKRLELDHIVPWSAYGGDDIDNLRTLCHDCNTYRSNQGFSLDLSCRQMPAGYECVYCNEDLVGDEDLRPVYCMICQQKGPGIPKSSVPLPGWDEGEVA